MLKLIYILKFILKNMSETKINMNLPTAKEAEYFPKNSETEVNTNKDVKNENQKISLDDLIVNSLNDNKLDKEEIEKIKNLYEKEKSEITQETKNKIIELKKTIENQTINEENSNLKKSLIDLDEILQIEKDTKLYTRWIKNLSEHNNSEKYSVDLNNKEKLDEILKNIENPDKKREIIELIEKTGMKEWKLSFIKNNKNELTPILELDTAWCNLYIKPDWKWNVDITLKTGWKLYVVNKNLDELEKFVKFHDTRESQKLKDDFIKAAIPSIVSWTISWFLKSILWIFTPIIWVWVTAYEWVKLYDKYNTNSAESLKVYENFKDNEYIDKIMEAYIKLTENWYIESFDAKNFKTIDWEKLNKEELIKKYDEIKNDKNFWTKYKTLAILKENWYNPEKDKKEANKYEIDLDWLWDDSYIKFDEKTWEIMFSTDKEIYQLNEKTWEKTWWKIKLKDRENIKFKTIWGLKDFIKKVEKSSNLQNEISSISNQNNKDDSFGNMIPKNNDELEKKTKENNTIFDEIYAIQEKK